MVNQASLTGESLPVRRCEGQSVYAGNCFGRKADGNRSQAAVSGSTGLRRL